MKLYLTEGMDGVVLDEWEVENEDEAWKKIEEGGKMHPNYGHYYRMVMTEDGSKIVDYGSHHYFYKIEED